jgi:hypothetical protein
MNKQTAVQWLWLNLTDDVIGALSPKQIKSIYYLVQKAKEMEKDKIENAYLQGFGKCDHDGIMDFNEYWEETYGGNNE